MTIRKGYFISYYYLFIDMKLLLFQKESNIA